MKSSSETTKTNEANRTGNTLENFVKQELINEEYVESTNNKKQLFNNRLSVGGKQFAQQVPCGKSIYDTARKCDFLIMNQDKFPDGLIIECKWQQSAGSVDEKYPFTLFNIFKIGVPTIILLDSGGYKESAMQWLKDQVDPNRGLIGVYSMSEFHTKVNNGLLG